MRPTIRTLVLSATALVFLAGACSSDDGDKTTTTTTTTEATSTTSSSESADTKRYDEEIQQELKDVGCYTGAEDGVVGPETDAAIVAFQTAEGLTPDGEVGSQTQAALTKAADAGETVCDGSTPTSSTTTTAASGGEAPCTATALLEGLPAEGETIATYVCSNGFAGGKLTDGTPFILESQNGQWYAPSQDPCGSASAGIDPEILQEGCPSS